MDPIVLNAVCALVGAAVGYAANWWQTNRKNVVNNIADEVSDLVDDLEKLTGVDIPDSLEDKIDDLVEAVVAEAEETIGDAVDDVQDALKEGDSLSDALHASLKDEVAALKNRIDSLDDLSIADLKVALKALGLPVGGKKAKLLERLTTALEGME
jgi:uncharacterized phage infection (PIP) family protein YhgE|tara:strand:+ start:2173 stop:2637 length:465 start_codon:yes stop_codon:yes gene_type:complete